jgi:hypothetical protein
MNGFLNIPKARHFHCVIESNKPKIFHCSKIIVKPAKFKESGISQRNKQSRQLSLTRKIGPKSKWPRKGRGSFGHYN